MLEVWLLLSGLLEQRGLFRLVFGGSDFSWCIHLLRLPGLGGACQFIALVLGCQREALACILASWDAGVENGSVKLWVLRVPPLIGVYHSWAMVPMPQCCQISVPGPVASTTMMLPG